MRTNRCLLMLAAAALAVTSVACGDDDDDEGASEPSEEETTTTGASGDPYGNGSTDTATTGGTAQGTGVKLSAVLTGDEEVPGPGVADGTGGADLTFTPGQVCYVLNVAMGEKPTLAHIHQGAKGASGPVVVDLKPTFELGEATHDAQGCAQPEQSVLDSITGNPAGFYVNIHTAEYPNGAVRGQLAAKT